MFSEWRRWDLHIHSPESFQHDFKLNEGVRSEEFKTKIWDRYIEELEKQSDVSCIGVTDYFSIDGYRKVLQAREAGRLKNYELILPNIEFRTSDTFYYQDGASNRINFHVIFSDEVHPDIIEREFLSSLSIYDDKGQESGLHRDNLISIGRTLKEHQPEFRDKDDYFIGCMTASVDLQNLCDLLERKAKFFQGKYLLVLAIENISKLKWAGQGHTHRKRLLHFADAVFSGSPSDRDFLLGKKTDDFLEEFTKFWPVLHGSDAHKFDDLFEPKEKKYCWIKSLPTFQGLKQIIYEPEQRIYIGEEKPKFTQFGHSISEIDLKDERIAPPVKISNTTLSLSHGLVAVIGGKGSGKTALLDLIANNFEDRTSGGMKKANRSASEIASSFVARNTKTKSDGALETSLLFLNSEEFSKSMQDGESIHPAKVTYLSQGKLDDYSSDGVNLQKKIKEVIFNKVRVVNSELAANYDLCKSTINSISEHINATSADIRNTYHKISQLDMKQLMSQREEKSQSVVSIDREVQSLLSAGHQQRYSEILEIQRQLDLKRASVAKIKYEIDQAKTRVQIVARENQRIIELNENLSKANLTGDVPTFNNNDILSSLSRKISNIDQVLGDIDEQRREIIIEIDSLSNQTERIDALQKKREADQSILDKIDADISLFSEYIEYIERLRDEQAKNIAQHITAYNSIKRIYRDIIDDYSRHMPEILRGVEFKSEIIIDKKKWSDAIFNLLDSRKKIGLEDVEEILSVIDLSTPELIPETVKAALKKIIELSSSLKRNKSILDLEEAFYSFPIYLNTSIAYNGILMDNLSMGQRGTVLLNIYLADGDNTLIIDQPEENLDNKYIYEVLVSAIKRAKLNRQIIIATHNANLVVNTDAEQVIIAEYVDGEITYQTGCIENKETRDEIALILEGGKEAFEKREARYRTSPV